MRAAWTVRYKRWLWPGSVAHAPHGQSHVIQQATQGMGSLSRKTIQRLKLLPGSWYFQLQRFCSSGFLLQLQLQHTAVLLDFATATIGVRVLLESIVAPVPLGAAPPAAAECSCARDCLATRHDNTLYPPRTWDCFFLYFGTIHYLSDLCVNTT